MSLLGVAAGFSTLWGRGKLEPRKIFARRGDFSLQGLFSTLPTSGPVTELEVFVGLEFSSTPPLFRLLPLKDPRGMPVSVASITPRLEDDKKVVRLNQN